MRCTMILETLSLISGRGSIGCSVGVCLLCSVSYAGSHLIDSESIHSASQPVVSVLPLHCGVHQQAPVTWQPLLG